MKIAWIIAGISTALCVGLMYNTWLVQKENQRLSFLNWTYQAEHRIIKDEIYVLEHKATYEDGYKEAIFKMGTPQNPGAYQDGWEAAMKIVGDGSYATGYHAAVQQFGYKDAKYYLVSYPKHSDDFKNDDEFAQIREKE